MAKQNYEEYWKLTNAFTNFNGKKFLDTLSVCIQFIDDHKTDEYSEEKYSKLQHAIHRVNPLNPISIRKSINQLVKMGFINSFLVSYPPQAKEYVDARSNKKRATLLSKIVYSNSSFNKAVNNKSSIKQINFLIQTLIEIGKLSKEEIIALMLIDIESYPQTFITKSALQEYLKEASETDFIERKYNQIGYLYNLLGKLNDLVFVKDVLYFKEDAEQIFGADLKASATKRDPYLHRLYKNQLQEECEEIYGAPKCVLEKLAYPVLIASHIKPFILSDEDEAYDPNNGLLLSRTIDSLFDLKYISFADDGTLLFSTRISTDVKIYWQNYKLDGTILTEKRKEYLAYHRSLMTEIDAKTGTVPL